MRKKMVALMIMLTVALGWAISQRTVAQASGDEKEVPVIVQSFASKQVRAGNVWKVYLKASDPEGKMKYIFATISQPGVGIYPVSITRIKGENQKELSGYMYLNTAPTLPVEFFNLTLSLAVSIQGKGGVFSQPVVFPFSFSPQPAWEAPPDGVFREQNLGSIMVTLLPRRGR